MEHKMIINEPQMIHLSSLKCISNYVSSLQHDHVYVSIPQDPEKSHQVN